MKPKRKGSNYRRMWLWSGVAAAVLLGAATLALALRYRPAGSELTNAAAPGVAQIAEGLRSAGR